MSYPVYMVPAGDVLPVLFDSFDGGTGASITLTGLAATDVEVFKDGSVTQRASDAGITLLDTDGIDFDGVTGIHGFSIDTGDNTDAGFYAVGSWYHVIVASVTVDAQTVNFIACAFRIMAAEAAAGVPAVDVTYISGDSTAANNAELMFDGTGYAGGTERLDVNVVEISDDSGAAGNLEAAFDGTGFNVGGGDIVVASVAAGGITASSIGADAITAAHIQNGAIDAGTFAAGAINAAAIAPDAIGASELATDAVTEITDAIWANAARTLSAATNITSTGAAVPITAGGLVSADATAISADTTAADRLEATLDAMPSGIVNDGAPGATAFLTGLTEATDDHYNGAFIVFTAGVLLGQSRKISNYIGSTKQIDVAVAFTEAPANSDPFIIIGRSE